MSGSYKGHKLFVAILVEVLSVTMAVSQVKLPDKPLINFLTYELNTSKITIDFNASKSPDISYYKLYTLDISTFPVTGIYLDSISADSLTYSYNPGTLEPLIYTLTAVDINENESLLSGDFHKPVKLNISYDSCSSSMQLEWDKYIGWKNNLNGYRIYCQKDEGEFELVKDIIDTTANHYIHNGIDENRDFKYYIEAYNNRGNSSLSIVKHKYTYMPPPPDFINLDYVSVLDPQTVEISFSADVSGIINDFRILKAKTFNGNYVPVQVFWDVKDEKVTLTDKVITQAEQYFYKVEALNSCLAPVLSSNLGNNMLLQGKANGSVIELNWNPYFEFSTGISEYRIYRRNQYEEYEAIAFIQSTENTFSEDIKESGYNNIKGEVEYYVEAIESGTNSYGFSGISRSNKARVDIETSIYMPNAFSPNNDGQNDYFLPIFDFIPKEYNMFIYDRSGKLLFHSEDPTLGWDGKMNRQNMAPEGVYIYHVEYLSYNGLRKNCTGSVTLVHP